MRLRSYAERIHFSVIIPAVVALLAVGHQLMTELPRDAAHQCDHWQGRRASHIKIEFSPQKPSQDTVPARDFFFVRCA